MEVEQAALLGHQESEVLLGRDLGHLAERLVRGIVVAILVTAVALLLDLHQLPFGKAERLDDGMVQIGMLVLAQQVFGLVADQKVLAPGKPELDVHHRRDGVTGIDRALLDPYPTGNQSTVNSL